MLRYCILILSILLLNNCAGLLPKGELPSTLYTLNAPAATPETKRLPVALQIVVPQAAPGLETEHIALRNGNNQIDYYAQARWAVTLPAVLQTILVQSFDNAQALASVSNDLASVKEHYDLLVEIRDFQIENKQAHVRLMAKMIKADDETMVASALYDENEPVSSENLQEIVSAFDRANQRVIQRMLPDMIKILSSR